jgi:hypothetical protein
MQTVRFHRASDLAEFLAIVVRKGLTYEVSSPAPGVWDVTLTGGY